MAWVGPEPATRPRSAPCSRPPGATRRGGRRPTRMSPDSSHRWQPFPTNLTLAHCFGVVVLLCRPTQATAPALPERFVSAMWRKVARGSSRSDEESSCGSVEQQQRCDVQVTLCPVDTQRLPAPRRCQTRSATERSCSAPRSHTDLEEPDVETLKWAELGFAWTPPAGRGGLAGAGLPRGRATISGRRRTPAWS